jgi:hypothetical protein
MWDPSGDIDAPEPSSVNWRGGPPKDAPQAYFAGMFQTGDE